MANLIKLKRSAVPGKVPLTTDLDWGELAINTADGVAYIKRLNGTVEEIIELGVKEFEKLTDTPNSFTGEAGKTTRVNLMEDALEFLAVGGNLGQAHPGTTPTLAPVYGDFYIASAVGDYPDFGLVGVKTGDILKWDGTGWIQIAEFGRTFEELSDTPSHYTGEKAKTLRVNENENAVEFLSVGGNLGTASTTTTPIGAASYGDYYEALVDGDYAGFGLTGVTAGSLLKRTNTAWVEVKASSGGTTKFTGLTDTPADYTGDKAKTLRVNKAQDAVEFLHVGGNLGDAGTSTVPFDNPAIGDYYVAVGSGDYTNFGLTGVANNSRLMWTGVAWIEKQFTFIDLVDVPQTYVGGAGKKLKVNDNETGVEFVDDVELGSVEYSYRWSTDTNATDPGPGRLKGNNSNASLITELYVSEEDRSGNNRDGGYLALGADDVFIVRDSNTSKGMVFKVDAQPTDNGTWFTIQVTFARQVPPDMNNGERCVVGLVYLGVKTFTGLKDTPGSYAGEAGKVPTVNATETGLEFKTTSGLPAGGTTDQVLAKNSNTDYDTKWVTNSGGGGVPEAPMDGYVYGRQSGAWILIDVPALPLNENVYFKAGGSAKYIITCDHTFTHGDGTVNFRTGSTSQQTLPSGFTVDKMGSVKLINPTSTDLMQFGYTTGWKYIHLNDLGPITTLEKFSNYSRVAITADTSNVTSLYQAFGYCENTSFPWIDTSNVTDFSWAWVHCTNLTSFPAIDTSSGTNFDAAWYYCPSLTSFPQIDTSNGTNFDQTWRSCTSLTSFPALDFSSGTVLNSMWMDCSNLACFEELDFSSLTSGLNTFGNCTVLTQPPSTGTAVRSGNYATAGTWTNPGTCP